MEQHSLQDDISVALRLKVQSSNVKAGDLVHGSIPKDVFEDYSFMKNIRGTTAYWRDQLYNLLARIRTLGPPTLFMSLSADDMNWPEVFMTIDPKLSYSDAENLSPGEKAKLLQANPVYAAIHFEHRWKAFLKYVLRGKSKPLGTIQARGSPHLHIFLWIADAPNFDTQEGREQAPDFIDKYISAQLPPDDEESRFLYQLVSRLQVHHHTNSCLKGKRTCRFDFPRLVSGTTRIKTVTDTGSPARFYVLRRGEHDKWINPYNKDVLMAWQANMDIQIVGSKYAAAVYVCTYVCKHEPDMIREMISKTIGSLPATASPRQKLSKLGNVILTHRILSGQESAFRMCGLQLVYSTRATIYINARPLNKRFRMKKAKKDIESLPADSSDIFVRGLPDHYQARPNTDEFTNMSIASFACWYNVVSANGKQAKNSVPLQHLEKCIKKRTKMSCLRTFQTSLAKDEEEFYYSLLYLFLPWRNEEDLILPFPNAKEAFSHKHANIDFAAAEYMQFAEKLSQAVQQIRFISEDDVQNMQSSFTPSFAEQATLDDSPHVENSAFTYLLDSEQQQSQLHKNDIISSELIKSLSVYTMTDEAYQRSLSELSLEQLNILQEVAQTYTSPLHLQTQLTIFITGGAGTGKSFLLRVIREHLLRINTSSTPNVLVGAPTGVAAYNVKALTLHKLLNLPIQHKSKASYTSLSGYMLKQLRDLFCGVKFLIVDEVSMVSVNTLDHIHRRLSEIKDTILQPDVYFGGLNIIMFGDLYQLRPVFGSYIFSPDAVAVSLWRRLFKLRELTENKRQHGDTLFAQILNRIRVKKHTREDVEVLLKRIVKRDQTDSSLLHIFPTRQKCDKHNTHQILQLQCKGASVYTVSATHNVSEDDLPDDDSLCSGLARTLKLCVGCRVMLTRNVQSATGLVNGAQGELLSFQWQHGDQPQTNSEMPIMVNILFDDHTVGQVLDGAVHQEVGITPLTAHFYYNNKDITRTQLPLMMSWATTVHKVQGLTLDAAVIDVGSSIFTTGMTYVALSRVKSLSGLNLLDFDPKKIMCSRAVDSEIERLRTD
jgi:DNA replication protein DnaC